MSGSSDTATATAPAHAPPSPKPAARNPQAFAHLYDEYVIDSAFLWLLRSMKVEQAQQTLEDIAVLEQRIESQLDGLLASPELGWAACEAALEIGEAGEVFTAAVVALHSREVTKIQRAVETGLAATDSHAGLISAFGWLPAGLVQPWIARLLNGKAMRHKYLGVAACSVRREDPGEALGAILSRDDCLADATLAARAARLAGELRRHDLLPMLLELRNTDQPVTGFWARWSLALLGHADAVLELKPYLVAPGPYRTPAMQIILRALPVKTAREVISSLSQDAENLRTIITATGILGDPHAVPWLIAKMHDPQLARLAGEALTNITGLDLSSPLLSTEPPPPPAELPEEDPANPDIGIDEDEQLPWPNIEQVSAEWQQRAANFSDGQRYFLGKVISPEWLNHVLAHGTQRQRHAAALELTLIDRQSRLINTRAKVIQ